MKRFKKVTAIVLSVIISVLLVVGFLFSYIPMNFKSKKYISLSGSLNISSDIAGGMYGEYNIKTENPTRQDIIDSMLVIKEVFEENGYKNTNIYAIGKSKIRIEVGAPRKGDSDYASVYSELASVGASAFSLRSTYSLEDTSVVVDGGKYVKKIKVFTQNSNKCLSIIFTDEGQEKYKELCNATSTIYLVLGDYAQSISVTGVSDYSQLTLNNTDYDNLIALEQKIKLGCTKIQLDNSTAEINTMAASLSAGESSSSSLDKTYNSSTVYVVAFSALFVVFVLGIALFAIRFGFYAVLILVSLLLNSYIFLGIVCLVPSIELGLSSIASLVLGTAMIYTYAYIFASKVKSEYNLGKSLSASLESAYKKGLPSLLISNIMMFLSSMILFLLSFGELTSVAIIFTICMALSLLTNLFIMPLLIKICISFNGFGTKVFALKKRADISEFGNATIAENKEEA